MEWGQVDVLWTIIFLLIILAVMYWSYLIFTNKRPYIKPIPPSNGGNKEEIVHMDDADLIFI